MLISSHLASLFDIFVLLPLIGRMNAEVVRQTTRSGF